ncbi:Beta-barrel assembly-enhancing protease [Tepidimonas alkaliphilus]|uniref:Beta-barrel assembly-enhancing protease n=1 Tax=Tepidimonas alkaliphilus TaxID=2588942 RepID=A0A554WBK5_9BURK|nr:M48 family metalloprotease [Tepidimonas alkaliphilus]TSE20953.1 Beta-barrel assembly-enhancing protease [Tepidimonas alkaliphilus]
MSTTTSERGAPRWRPVGGCLHRRDWLRTVLGSAFGAATAAALLPWLAGPARAQAALPALGDGGDMTLAEERELGDQIARALYRDPAYLDDAPLQELLQALWTPLLDGARQRGELSDDMAQRYAWRLLLGRDPTVNAFALPGGYFGVHLGLIGVTQRPEELASVLAHELCHVTQRHIARLLTRQSQQAPLVLAAMILGALAASAARNADIASAAIAGGQAMALQGQLNFSRDMEREADRLGLAVLLAAGFDGHGFIGMFERLQQSARLNDDGSFPYLRSHPLTSERIADMRARLGLLPVQGAASTAAPADWHQAMAARARVLADPSAERLRVHAQTRIHDAASAYAAALAAGLLRDVDGALRALAALRDAGGSAALRRAADALQLELLTRLHAEPALPTPERARLPGLVRAALADGTRAALLLAAPAAALTDGELARDAAARLQAWCVQHPHDGAAWDALAGLQRALGQPVRAGRAEGEARLAQLDYAGALERFRAAQRLAAQQRGEDWQELAVLDARVRHVETLLREQEAARRRR